jgi:porin
MTGDWGGERTKLIEQGIDINDYVGEVGGNLHGYNDDKTARYSDQFGLGVAGPAKLGADNTQAKIQLTNRNGRNISNDRISDPRAGTLSSSQEVYGRGHGASDPVVDSAPVLRQQAGRQGRLLR